MVIGTVNKGDEDVIDPFGRLCKTDGIGMVVVNAFFQKMQKHRVGNTPGLLRRQYQLKEIADCKAVRWEGLAWQHRMVMSMVVRKMKGSLRGQVKCGGQILHPLPDVTISVT